MTFLQLDESGIYQQQHKKEECTSNTTLSQFNHILRRHAAFNTLFLILGSIEFLLLLSFFTFFVKSALLALCLGVIFFTFFVYFILRLYFKAQKKEQFETLRDQYVFLSQSQNKHKENTIESYIGIANACTKLSKGISGAELSLYPAPSWLKMLEPYGQKLSQWFHWKDVHDMQEILLLFAVEQHIKLVKCEPVNLKAHSALANAYVTLSALYIDPKKGEDSLENRFLYSEKLLKEFKSKFRIISLKAIEEFKILLAFAPNDPWVHAQLAYSYHDMNMPLEEIKEYETLLKIDGANVDYLYKLGYLYFQQGMNAQGLGIYERLKQIDSHKAESLINHYGTIDFL